MSGPMAGTGAGVANRIMFVQGKGYRVGMMQPHFVAIRHVSAEEARAFADELASETGTELAPVLAALRGAADKLDALGLPGAEVDGHG